MELSTIFVGWVWLDEVVSPVVRFLNDFQHGHPILIASLLGFFSGFLIGIPVGPVNLTIMNEGARFGFLKAALISIGASTMESLYCAIAFTGFASFFGNLAIKTAMELFSFAFLMFLGFKFLTTKTPSGVTHISEAADKLGAKLEKTIGKKFHAHSAFMLGFIRTLGNPGVLLFWIIIAVNFSSRGWVSDDLPGKFGFVGGVFLGTLAWFFGLSYAASLGYGKFSDKTLLRMERFSGFCLIVMALLHGGLLVHQLMQHKR
jgi:putative LysE/RhtB family amino acid efflux pump